MKEEQTKLEEGTKLEEPKRRPEKSLRLNFAYSQSSIDVSLWEGRMSEKGKLMPASISMRLQDANPQVTRNAVYFKAADALKIANILQNFAFSAMEEDSVKRIEVAKERKAAVAIA